MLKVSRDRCMFLVGMETIRELGEITKSLDREEKEFEALVAHFEQADKRKSPQSTERSASDSDTDDELLPTVTLGKLLLKSSFPTVRELIAKYKTNPEETSLEEIRYNWANVRLQIRVGKRRFEEMAARQAARLTSPK